MNGHALILNGKALCRACLLYEQDKWEIVPGSPGKGGVRVIFHKALPGEETRIARRLFHTIGIDPAKLPLDPLKESRMPDEACNSCEDEKVGKRRRKLVGEFQVAGKKPGRFTGY